MPSRQDAQRKHIIHSLDTLLYQLHALSFFLSPAIWGLLSRALLQLQLPKPRETDAHRSLRFWFALVLFFNASSVWAHAVGSPEAAVRDRAIVLDFVGMAYAPSKFQLLALDALIIILSWVLITIAYESSLTDTSVPTILQPPTADTTTSPAPSLPSTPSLDDVTKPPPDAAPAYVVDLHLTALLRRLRDPPPDPGPPRAGEMILPLPNTTAWPLPMPRGLRMLVRAQRRAQQQAQQQEGTRRNGAAEGQEDARERRVPGAMDDGG